MRIEKNYFTDYQQTCMQQKADATHPRNISKYVADSGLMNVIESLDLKFTGIANILVTVAKYLHMDILAECNENSMGQITLTTDNIEIGLHCPDEVHEVFCRALYAADGVNIAIKDGLLEIKLLFRRADYNKF